MKTGNFPYQKFEGAPAWAVVDQAVEDLVQNRDLIEQTHRRYVVGFLISSLKKKGMLTSQALAAHDKGAAKKGRVRGGGGK